MHVADDELFGVEPCTCVSCSLALRQPRNDKKVWRQPLGATHEASIMQEKLELTPRAKRGDDETRDQDAPVKSKSFQKASNAESPKKNSKNCNLGGLSIMVTTRMAKEGLRVQQGEEKATSEEAIAKSPN